MCARALAGAGGGGARKPAGEGGRMAWVVGGRTAPSCTGARAAADWRSHIVAQVLGDFLCRFL